MHWRPEFSFPSSPARGPGRVLPPRPPSNTVAPRPSDEEEVRWLQASPDYAASSGTPSPPLWAHAHHDHQHRLFPASAGSSPSRAQAIAGYRREMLDLVRGLPESAYELSLRDIVERPSASPPTAPLPTPPLPPPPAPTAPPSSNATDAASAVVPGGHEPAASAVDEQQAAKPLQQSGGKTKQGRKQQQRALRKQRSRSRSRSLERSVSLDTGLLIKFFMPLSIGRGGKKKVSPKPDAKDAKKKKTKQGTKDEKQKQEEWWRKSEFSEAGSSSRTSSTGSSNDSIRNGAGKNDGGGDPRAPPVRSRSRKRDGCYGFFRAHKSKNVVSQD